MATYNELSAAGVSSGRMSAVTPITGAVWADLQEVWRAIGGDLAARGGDSSTSTRLTTTSAAVPVADYRVELVIRATTLAGDTTDIGIEARRNSFDNADYIQFKVNATTISISERQASDGGTSIDSTSWSPSIDTDYTLAVELEGTAVRLYIDDVLQASGTCVRTTAGYVCVLGEGTADNSGWQWKTVKVLDIPSGGGSVAPGTLAFFIGGE